MKKRNGKMKISIFLIICLIIFFAICLISFIVRVDLFLSERKMFQFSEKLYPPKTDDCTQIEKQKATVFIVSKKLPDEFGEIPLCIFDSIK